MYEVPAELEEESRDLGNRESRDHGDDTSRDHGNSVSTSRDNGNPFAISPDIEDNIYEDADKFVRQKSDDSDHPYDDVRR